MKRLKIGQRVKVKKYKTSTGYSFGGYEGEVVDVFDKGKDWINYCIYPDCWLKFGEPKKGSVIEGSENLYLLKNNLIEG